MGKYGFAIAGCGMISRFHAMAIGDMKKGRLVAVASRSKANARKVGEEFGVDWTTDYEALLRRSDVDVVNVCTPSGAHMEYAVKAARAGKHVVIEKPLDITLARCDKIIRACKDAKVALGVIFPSRFHEASRLIKKEIESGRFGRLTLGDAYVKWWRSQQYYDEGGWKGTKKYDGGGALMNQSIHAIDLLLYFMGPVKRVTAMVKMLAHRNIEVEDTAVASLEFRNGALGMIEGATSAYPGFLKRIEISGDKGSVVLEEEDIRQWRFDRDTARDKRIRKKFAAKTKTGGGASDPSAISHEGHRRQLEDFIGALEKARGLHWGARKTEKAPCGWTGREKVGGTDSCNLPLEQDAKAGHAAAEVAQVLCRRICPERCCRSFESFA
jgi:predicted dehydrogenase